MKVFLLFLILPGVCISQNFPDEIIENDQNPMGNHLTWGPDFIDPSFPGGNKGLADYVQENLEYPSLNCISGTVYVQFIVDSAGAVNEAKIVKGITESMDVAALKLVSNMPNWIPAIRENKPVSEIMTIPINFVLEQVQEKDSIEVIHIEIGSCEEVEEEEDKMEINTATISWNETDPSFPGGQLAMTEYIDENLNYPMVDLIEGVVYVQFLVDTAGFIQDIEIRRELSDTLDAAVIKMVSEMPQWIPGTFKDKPIAVKMSLPVRFDAEE